MSRCSRSASPGRRRSRSPVRRSHLEAHGRGGGGGGGPARLSQRLLEAAREGQALGLADCPSSAEGEL